LISDFLYRLRNAFERSARNVKQQLMRKGNEKKIERRLRRKPDLQRKNDFAKKRRSKSMRSI